MKQSKIHSVDAFLPFGESNVSVCVTRKITGWEDRYKFRIYSPSSSLAGLLADIIFELSYSGKVTVEPFIQTAPVSAWGWNARIR